MGAFLWKCVYAFSSPEPHQEDLPTRIQKQFLFRSPRVSAYPTPRFPFSCIKYFAHCATRGVFIASIRGVGQRLKLIFVFFEPRFLDGIVDIFRRVIGISDYAGWANVVLECYTRYGITRT